MVAARRNLGILLSSAYLVGLASAQQCEAEIAACAADGTCNSCRHYGTRCSVPDSDESAWSAPPVDSTGACGSADLWDYGGLNLDGSLSSFDRNGAPGDQSSESSASCECRALLQNLSPPDTYGAHRARVPQLNSCCIQAVLARFGGTTMTARSAGRMTCVGLSSPVNGTLISRPIQTQII